MFSVILSIALNAAISEKLLGVTIRHGATVIGAHLIGAGIVDEQSWSVVTGGAVTAGGVALSYFKQRWR